MWPDEQELSKCLTIFLRHEQHGVATDSHVCFIKMNDKLCGKGYYFFLGWCFTVRKWNNTFRYEIVRDIAGRTTIGLSPEDRDDVRANRASKKRKRR